MPRHAARKHGEKEKEETGGKSLTETQDMIYSTLIVWIITEDICITGRRDSGYDVQENIE
jgi:hypothetical protein